MEIHTMRWEIDPGDPSHPLLHVWREDMASLLNKKDIQITLDEEDLRQMLRLVQDCLQSHLAKEKEG